MNEKVFNNIESWKKSLLDISSRNQAINFRRRKSSTLQIIHPSVDEFLDKLINSRNIIFAEMFDDEEEDEEVDSLLDEVEDDFVTIYGVKLPVKDTYSQEELQPIINTYLNKKKGTFLFSLCNNKTQRKILRNLMKKARTFKEENAINVLYVSVGYLEWYESKESDESHRAPLLFMAAELSQDSFDAPFKVTFPECDLLLNDSLVRKLSQDYGLDISFDIDQGDLSNFEIYREYRKFIYSKISDKRWRIYDELDLGIFSFSKINMVKDLEENVQRICDNPLIQQLVGDHESKEYDKFYDEEDIDKVIDPENYYHILDADSSQEMAIQSAISGKSFVLQGPPGTGKSQTITNIITELIARNKKVLFVAEKKAALDVVYNNLKKIGLNDYALPIHNSKLDKKEVLRELANTLEKGQHSITIDGEFSNSQIHKYNHAKTQLLEYPKIILQKRHPINKSLYQLYGLLLKYQKHDEIPFRVNKLNQIGDQELQQIELVINSFYNANFEIKFNSKNHPLYGFKYEQLTIREKEDIKHEIKSIIQVLASLVNEYDKIALFKVKNSYVIRDLDNYRDLLDHITKLKHIDAELFNQDDFDRDILAYETLIRLDVRLVALKKQIEEVAEIEITKLDMDRYKRITRLNQSFLKRLFSAEYRKLKKDCLLYLKITKPTFYEIVKLIDTADEYNKLTSQYKKEVELLRYKPNYINESILSENLYHLKWMKEYNRLSGSAFILEEEDRLSVLLNYLNKKKIFDDKIEKFNSLFIDFSSRCSNIKRHFDDTRIQFDNVIFSKLTSYFETIDEEFYRVEEILSFNHALNLCDKYGLSDYCKKIIDLSINKNYIDVFYKRFYILLVDDFLKVLLPGFNGSTLDLARSNFKEAEFTIQRMAKARIERNIINEIPNYNGVEGYNFEVSTLRAEANKSRKILPFRVLFNKIPNLILQLKPCLMMSPLSVSTFLRNNNMTFDTVIFDEASQVKPENAIGAIFRAKQFIVTGDKEQLPPTNFFQNVDDEENNLDNFYDTTSFDSILEVSSSFISPIKLRWHYRSKFEELIRPSNKEIYRDLITFPSKNKPSTYEGIKFMYVNGLYLDRKNEIEADQVINSLAEIIETYGTTKSVGVVTFNNEQQLLIERKINHFRRTHQQYEEFFTNNVDEPFFVKNIENVQGDERDIIIMSVVYGPDGKGKISMNFGPLNQANGYRRLNVAVTRAKVCLVLVTSIKGTDIDLNRTESRGARFLKNYLDYAEFGEDDKVDNLNDLADFDSAFEEDVYHELVNLGYQVRKQVGCSGYRIDLAVINPNNPSHYLVGIECDGATYHSSKSVRDRDRLRQQVLEDRNWIIYRIWSTDWIKSKKSQIEKMDRFIKNINTSIHKPIIDNLTVIPVISKMKQQSKVEFDIYPNYDDITQVYGTSFYGYHIQRFILEIIKKTSPIHEDELKRIVPYFYGRKKYTSAVHDKIRPILKSLSYAGEVKLKGKYILYKNMPVKFRETTKNSTRRDFGNIHPDELKDGILKVLNVTKKMQEDELYSIILKLCGFRSSSLKIKDYISDIIGSLVMSNTIRISEDKCIEILST